MGRKRIYPLERECKMCGKNFFNRNPYVVTCSKKCAIDLGNFHKQSGYIDDDLMSWRERQKLAGESVERAKRMDVLEKMAKDASDKGKSYGKMVLEEETTKKHINKPIPDGYRRSGDIATKKIKRCSSCHRRLAESTNICSFCGAYTRKDG